MRLAAWRTPNCQFIVVHDQDTSDCIVLKSQFRDLTQAGGRPDAVVAAYRLRFAVMVATSTRITTVLSRTLG